MQIKWFEELDSTNDELLRHLSAYDNLSVVAAFRQTAGRGQRGNSWHSADGENLTFSVLLKPSALPAAEFMSLTFLATLCVKDWLCRQGVPAVIKWPNDIYVGKRKICGMLVENTLAGGRIVASVIGIGLNLNQTEFPGQLVNPVSLRQLSGRDYPLESTLEELLAGFHPSALETRSGRSRLWKAYNQGLFQQGLLCPYRDLLTGEEFPGTIKGVTREGRLLMADGTTYNFKEIGYIL
jgi:BirA family biotin operon repressor/biotin-[acetyl-CoA-carboxylase] ligase